jgi:Cu/Ag efflux pump CusA
LTGTSSSIVVRLFGPEMTVLRSKAQEVEKAMSGVAGVINLKVEPQVLVPQVQVQLRPDSAERFGLTAGQVRRATSTLLRGSRVGGVYEGQKRYAVVVWGEPQLRTDVAALRSLLLDTPSGAQIRLGDVADVSISPMANEIKRESASRRIDITCNVQGRDLGSVAAEIETNVRKLSFDREYHPEFLGEYAARQQSSRRLFLLSALAVVGIVMILYVDFQSWRLTGIVMVTITFALAGGVFGVLMTGGVLSLGSLVGFVTVLGIAARNGIMMVSHYRHLEQYEGEKFGPTLILRGAEERLAPIMMTALATGLALLPLILAGGKPGNEIEYPLAVVILGGLVTSTILNLCVVPALYLLFGAGALEKELT